MRFEVTINSQQKAMDFVERACKCSGDVLITGETTTVDGKSFLGVMSLNLSLPVTVEIANVEDFFTLFGKEE